MKKLISVLSVSGVIFAALWIIRLFRITEDPLLLALIGAALFFFGSAVLKILMPRLSVTRFFGLKSMSLLEWNLTVSVAILLICGSFLLNYLTSLLYAAFAVDSPAAFSGTAYESDGMAILCMAVLPAFFEELFFRGALYSTLRGGGKSPLGKYRGGAAGLATVVLIPAFLFMLLHGPSWYFISDFYAGVLLALLVLLTGSLFSSMAAHLLANTASYFLAIYGGRLEAAGIENLTVHLVVICFLGAICHVLHLLKKLILFRAAEDRSRVNENSRRWEEQKKGEDTYGNKRKKEGSR